MKRLPRKALAALAVAAGLVLAQGGWAEETIVSGTVSAISLVPNQIEVLVDENLMEFYGISYTHLLNCCEVMLVAADPENGVDGTQVAIEYIEVSRKGNPADVKLVACTLNGCDMMHGLCSSD